MSQEELFKDLGEKFNAIVEEGALVVDLDRLPLLARYLKEDLGYDYFCFMTAVDWVEHFTLVYRVRNIEERHELTFNVKIEKDETVPSLAPIYKGALWMEREVFDLFGIYFENHPDLRRILLPEDYEGHPLRKDFPMDAPFPPYR